MKFKRQVAVPVIYKGRRIGEHRLDLLVEDAVVVEIKSVEARPGFRSTVLFENHGKRLGLLINSTPAS